MRVRIITREEFRDELIEELKSQIPFEAICKFLPFQTRIVSGHNYNHIQSQSIFRMVTEKREIEDGDTLCGRRGLPEYVGGVNDENCPGCLAIGRGLAVRDLI